MKYNNNDVRRQDRLLEQERATEILSNGEYGILSLIDTENNCAYGVPVNYIWDKKDSIYIHCAKEGRKLKCIEKNPNVSFCIIGNTHLLPNKFTTEYESIILKGIAHINLSNEEKMKGLEGVLDKFSAPFKEIGMKYTEKSFPRVEVIRIDITEFSGKCKRVAHAD
jgi:nitroimidazol reductase NimA-like FMN-containing flavoprotein (pyridoxamine 5'-phosphate oxidase superfamily)